MGTKTNSPQKNLENTVVSGRLRKYLKPKYYIAAAVTVIIVLALYFFVPNFWTGKTIANILISASTIGLLAVGISFVLVGQGLDISLPAVMAASAVIGAKVMSVTQNIALGVLVVFVTAIAFGLINGVSVAVFKMYPFIVTMSTMVLAQGISALVSQSVSIANLPEAFISVVDGKLWVIPVPIIILLLFAAIGYIVLNKSLYGRKIFAIGVNEKAARVCGIRVTRVKLSTYIISSVYAAITGIVLTARLKSASPMMASDNMNLDVLAAAVLGGVSMDGGTGTVIGALVGAIIMTAYSTAMNLLGVDNFQALIYKGLIILAVTYLDATRSKGKERG